MMVMSKALVATLVGLLALPVPQDFSVSIDGDLVIRVLAKDAIPAIDEPVFVEADRADFMSDDELVIGVADSGTAKAYSTWLLDRHEIVNDVIGSTPIAVTWCPLCYTGIVYIRKNGDQELTFGVSGRLWRENLVMYDRQTDSWWSQANGRSIRGPMERTQLEWFPSDMMTWKQWRTLHPGTLVLSKRVRGRLEGMSDSYKSYHDSADIGVTRTRRVLGDLDPKARLVSFLFEDASFSVPLDELASKPLLVLPMDGKAVLIVGTPDKKTAKIFVTDSTDWSYLRAERGRAILRNERTGTEWDGFTGEALSEGEQGQRLQEIQAQLSYLFAWISFYPQTQILDVP